MATLTAFCTTYRAGLVEYVSIATSAPGTHQFSCTKNSSYKRQNYWLYLSQACFDGVYLCFRGWASNGGVANGFVLRFYGFACRCQCVALCSVMSAFLSSIPCVVSHVMPHITLSRIRKIVTQFAKFAHICFYFEVSNILVNCFINLLVWYVKNMPFLVMFLWVTICLKLPVNFLVITSFILPAESVVYFKDFQFSHMQQCCRLNHLAFVTEITDK